MILKCTCNHESQDKLHGSFKRVHNKTKADPPAYRCTVCLSVRRAGSSEEVKPTKK